MDHDQQRLKRSSRHAQDVGLLEAIEMEPPNGLTPHHLVRVVSGADRAVLAPTP